MAVSTFSTPHRKSKQGTLCHFYITCLKRISFCLGWSDYFFAHVFDELSLEDRCARYWSKYLVSLADSVDGEMLFEWAYLNEFRHSWAQREFSIRCLRVSKRYVENISILEKCVKWTSANSPIVSTPHYEMEEIELLQNFPDSFL